MESSAILLHCNGMFRDSSSCKVTILCDYFLYNEKIKDDLEGQQTIWSIVQMSFLCERWFPLTPQLRNKARVIVFVAEKPPRWRIVVWNRKCRDVSRGFCISNDILTPRRLFCKNHENKFFISILPRQQNRADRFFSKGEQSRSICNVIPILNCRESRLLVHPYDVYNTDDSFF